MQINKRIRAQLQLQKIIFVVLLLCTVGMLAWLSRQHAMQFDWTMNARNSLSRGSVSLLGTMEGPIVVNVFVREDATLRQAVEEILKRYQRIKPDFTYHLINPDIDIVQARADEISAYGQIIIKYANRKENIASLSEQSISSALLKLSRHETHKVLFLGGHSERDPDDDSNRGYATLKSQLQGKGFEVARFNLLENAIADDTSVLVIAAPSKPLLEGERQHIEDFLDHGGNLLWMADPGDLAGLDALADTLGIVFQSGMVVDNNTYLRATLQIEHPAIIPVLEYFPHAINKGLDYNTLFPLARGVGFKPVDDKDNDHAWKRSELFRSFEKSWIETSGLSDEIVFNTADGDVAGPITLGVALDRPAPMSGDKTGNKSNQRIVVVGDSDFLANAYIGSGANLALGMNIFNWLSGDDELIAVEPKAAPDTRLQLNDLQIMLIGFGFFLLLPGILLLAGFVIWFRRRKR